MDRDLEPFFNCIRKRLYRRLHALARPLAELKDIAVSFPEIYFPDITYRSSRSHFSTEGCRNFRKRQVLDEIA